MNALRLASRRTSPIGRRFASAAGPAPAIPKPPVPEMYHYNLKKAWFSDSSTYPLLFSLAFAGAFIVGMTFNAFAHYKDIKITKDRKGETIRTWGKDKTTSFAETMASKDYHAKPEGLGIDHAEWTKAKTAASSGK